MAVTIKDLAREAGVSRGTVDRVLHNRPGVNEEVAKKVKRIAQEMGFIPNKAGKILATLKQRLRIACILPSVGNIFFNEVKEGFDAALNDLSDYGIDFSLIEIKGFDIDKNKDAIEYVKAQHYDGLIIATIDVSEITDLIDSLKIPVITINTDISSKIRLCYIGADYFKGGYTSASLLAKIGKAVNFKILIITGSRNIFGHNLRIEGFKSGLKHHNINFEILSTIEVLDDDEISYLKTKNEINKFKDINVIFVTAAGIKGVAKALSEVELKNKPHFLTFDLIPETERLLKDNIVDFTICQEPFRQGYESLNAMFNYLISDKKTTLENIITETIIKISENL